MAREAQDDGVEIHHGGDALLRYPALSVFGRTNLLPPGPFPRKVDGFAPHTQHVNFRKVRDQDDDVWRREMSLL